MQRKPIIKTEPFTLTQLKHFKKEMDEAGGLAELMVKKEALQMKEGISVISLYPDREAYKEKYLTGVYEPLRKKYNTDVPYVFWCRMYQLLQEINLEK